MNNNIVIHCKTQEQCDSVTEYYGIERCWAHCHQGDQTCIRPYDKFYGDLEYFVNNGCTIITFEEWQANHTAGQPELSELQKQWNKLAPDFFESLQWEMGAHTPGRGSDSTGPYTSYSFWVESRPKQPEWKVIKTESEAILLKDGQEIESMPLEHYAEWVKLIVPSESGK